jgi:hypothetical protein
LDNRDKTSKINHFTRAVRKMDCCTKGSTTSGSCAVLHSIEVFRVANAAHLDSGVNRAKQVIVSLGSDGLT